MSDLVRVKEPPESRRSGRKVDWRAVVAEARAHPDEWVLVPVPLHVSVAANIRRGQYVDIPPAEFTVTTRRAHVDEDDGKRVHLYIKVRP